MTTGVSFSIGFGGKEPSGDFTYSHDVTRNIKDWKVTNESSGLVAAWNYRSAYPWDYVRGSGHWGECKQPIYGPGTCYIQSDPNELSLNNMHLHTQSVYRTPTVSNGDASFLVMGHHVMNDLYCQENGGVFANNSNANGIPKHGSTVATITAFYADDFQVQLTVKMK